MAGNRYYAKNPQEVFESYEWLMREKLTELDRMARNMAYDLGSAWVPAAQIQPMMQQFFSDMWQQVAATEEQKYKKRRKHA